MKTKEKSGTVGIGIAASPVGLKGELRIKLHTHDSTNLKEGKNLLFRHTQKSKMAAKGHEEFTAECKSVRYQKGIPIIKVDGIEDRTAAESLTGMELCLAESELDELPEGEHYVRDLIGCTVRDIAEDREIGTLKDVIQNTAQSVLEVETPEGKSVLIPAVDAFMRNIDEDAGIIDVELIPGFID